MTPALIISILLIHAKAFAQPAPDDLALKLFQSYLPQIENSHSLVVQYTRVVSGDLNYDGLEDVVVEFGLGAKNSNGIILRQAAIYVNSGTTVKVVAGFEPDYCPSIKKIQENTIIVEELEACTLPWPKVVNTHKYRLKNRTLVEVN